MTELLTFIMPDVDKLAFLRREKLQRCNLEFLEWAHSKSLPCSQLVREHFVKPKWHHFLKVSCKYVDLLFLCNFLVKKHHVEDALHFYASLGALEFWSGFAMRA